MRDRGRAEPRRVSVVLGLVALAAATVASYWPVAVGRVPFPSDLVVQFPPWETVRSPGWRPAVHGELGDLATQFYLWKAYAAGQLRSGTLPLWQPHILLGTPFLAEPQTSLFYPANWLFLILPAPAAWALSFPIRTLLAGLGALLLARTLGAGRWGMALAGVTYAFAGYATTFQGHPLLDAALWLPYLCVAVDRLARAPSAGSVAVAAVAFAMPILGGNPEAAFHAVSVACAWAAWRLWRRVPDERPEPRGRAVAAFAAAGVLAMVLTAVQLVPTSEWLGQIERSLGRRWQPRPSHELLTFVCRDVSGNPNLGGVAIPEGAGYAGMLALLLAPLGLLGPSRRDARFWAAIGFVAVEVIYGWFPFGPLVDHLPLFRTVPNWRLLIVLDLVLAVLAGCGLSRLLGEDGEGPAPGRAPALLAGTAVVLVSAATAWLVVAAPPTAFSGGMWRRGPLASLVVLALSVLALALLYLARGKWRARLGPAVVVLAAGDMVSMAWGAVPFVRPQEIFPPSPVFDLLRRSDPPPGRVAALDGTYPPNYAIRYGLDEAGGYDFPLRRTLDLLSPFVRFDGSCTFRAEQVLSAPPRLLDLLGVRFLVANTWNSSAALLAGRPARFRQVAAIGKVRVFENPSALGPAFVVPTRDAVVETDDRRALARLLDPAFDPRVNVLVASRLPELPVRPTQPPGTGPPHLGVETPMAGRVRVDVMVDEPSVVVLSESHYPGWRVAVDGHPRPLLRVDYAFLGVAVEPGAHLVEFTFAPVSVRVGAMVSSAGVLILLGLVVTAAVRRRHGAPE